MFAPGTVTLRVIGGTCGKWQAGVDYLQNILLPYLERFVEKIEMKILKRGYYPRGGGEVELKITPRWKLKDFDSYSALLEEVRVKTAKIALSAQGKLEQIRGVVNVSSELQEKEVGERIQRVCEGDLKKLGVPVNVRVDYVNSLSVGGEVLLWGVFSNNGQVDYDNPVLLGGDALIEKGKRSEEVGKEAVAELLEEVESEAAVDVHLADMLIPFMGLLCGSSIEVSSVSDHVLTNIYVVEKFLDVGFSVEGKRIRVEKC